MVDFSQYISGSSDKIRDCIKRLRQRGNITKEDIRELGCNSWEWEHLIPGYTDAHFMDTYKYFMDSCGNVRSPAVTYNEAMCGHMAKEVLRRFSGWRPWTKNTSVDQLIRVAESDGFECKVLIRRKKTSDAQPEGDRQRDETENPREQGGTMGCSAQGQSLPYGRADGRRSF